MEATQKHPQGLLFTSLAYAVMSFGFGILNSLLILYITERLHFGQVKAYMLFAAFNALLYTLPVYNGYIAGQFGYKRSLLLGVALNIIALCVLAVPSDSMLYLALALYAIGASLASPAFLVVIGKLYAKNDARRESGFTLFYVTFNISYVLAAIVGGYAQTYFNFSVSFIIAAGIVLFTFVLYFLGRQRLVPHPSRTLKPNLDLSNTKAWTYLIIAVLIPVLPALWLLKHAHLNNEILIVVSIFVSLGILMMALRQKDPKAKKKLIAFILLSIISIGFFSLYMLEPSLITIFIKNNVNRNILGSIIPPSVYYGLEPFFIVVLGSLFSLLWIRLRRINKDPSLPTKFSGSVFVMAGGFFLFALAISMSPLGTKINSIWVVGAYLFLTVAELLISPIGLAMVGRLAPEGNEGLLMGVWQLFMGLSAAISGYLATLAKTPKHGTLIATNPIYHMAFIKIGSIALVLGGASLLIWRFLKKTIDHSERFDIGH